MVDSLLKPRNDIMEHTLYFEQGISVLQIPARDRMACLMHRHDLLFPQRHHLRVYMYVYVLVFACVCVCDAYVYV